MTARSIAALVVATSIAATMAACASESSGTTTTTSTVASTVAATATATASTTAVPATAVPASTSSVQISSIAGSSVDATTFTTVGAVTTTTTPTVAASMIAAEIVATERGIRDAALSVDEVASHGRRQQRAYRLLARHTDLQDAVSALIPDDVRVAFDFNIAARQAVVDHAAGSSPSDPSPTLPAWTIIAPLPIDELLGYYQEAEAVTGVPWEYLAAINLVETRTGRIFGASSAGALGPMQFLPTTWAACCTGDIDDPHDAILGAATYLVDEGAPADMQAALYGYNPNDGYVGQVTAYAANLMADPLAYGGYHAWEVYVGSVAGTVRLPVGYTSTEPVDALAYVRDHPDDVV